MMREIPPPPSGLSHLSSTKAALPSASSNALQMVFCNERMYSEKESLIMTGIKGLSDYQEKKGQLWSLQFRVSSLLFRVCSFKYEFSAGNLLYG
jgi:hypothetical protein